MRVTVKGQFPMKLLPDFVDRVSALAKPDATHLVMSRRVAMLPCRRPAGDKAGLLRRVVAVAAGAACLLSAGAAWAADTAAGPVPIRPFPVAQIFTFLFLMLGPIKIIGPFAKMTKQADAALTRQIALRATLFSSLALVFAAVLGDRALSSYGIPLPVLALSGGVILFLVALQNILAQFEPPASHGDGAAEPAPAPTLKLAMSPLAFPTIVTPYGIAALVVFLAVSPNLEARLTIGAILLAIMLLNLGVMLVTRRILPVLGVLLPILGAVLGIVQVALGLQIINNSLRALGVL
jgi:multiple antibiotic resistance protein